MTKGGRFDRRRFALALLLFVVASFGVYFVTLFLRTISWSAIGFLMSPLTLALMLPAMLFSESPTTIHMVIASVIWGILITATVQFAKMGRKGVGRS